MPKSYSDKLKDPRWQKKRLEVLEAGGWTCESCGGKENTLHVHHGIYEKGKEPWDYPLFTLHVLCEDCHSKREETEKFIKKLMALMSSQKLELAALAIDGISFLGNKACEDLGSPSITVVKRVLFQLLPCMDYGEDFNRIGFDDLL